MKEILTQVLSWRDQGLKVALAKVVAVEGSSPREVGATMAVNERAEVAGSVSGGCVEGAVVQEALGAMGASEATMKSVGILPPGDDSLVGCARTVTFGYSDDEAFAVGLTCGGTLHILVQPELPSFIDLLAEKLSKDEPLVVATVFATEDLSQDTTSEYFAEMNQGVMLPSTGASMMVDSKGEVFGSLGNADLDRVVKRDAQAALEHGRSTRRHFGRSGQSRAQEVGVVFEVYAPPPRMLIFGAVDFTAALARVSKVLGYQVTVCDARPIFATKERFPMADQVEVDWPDRYIEKVGAELGPSDAICVLTHDPKFDVPAITEALKTKVGYIGAMGSRRTHSERLNRLIETGIDPKDLGRVMGPIGLDIGATSPEETAISIMAEVIACSAKKNLASLKDSQGPIHVR